ncbi:850_t:CDS:2 [Ambispora gerdemannii]|uniref:850_t:CDS:1 n=1 Tax=Ambispora gerdemannii TaxID=144530 RepID=A0A9N9DIN2_9GLOM|nr:850_t:CDS:2 [Ambispora gerdemannii]
MAVSSLLVIMLVLVIYSLLSFGVESASGHIDNNNILKERKIISSGPTKTTNTIISMTTAATKKGNRLKNNNKKSTKTDRNEDKLLLSLKNSNDTTNRSSSNRRPSTKTNSTLIPTSTFSISSTSTLSISSTSTTLSISSTPTITSASPISSTPTPPHLSINTTSMSLQDYIHQISGRSLQSNIGGITIVNIALALLILSMIICGLLKRRCHRQVDIMDPLDKRRRTRSINWFDYTYSPTASSQSRNIKNKTCGFLF